MDVKAYKKRIIKNSIWGLGASIVNRFGALVFTIILARVLMPEKYGIYSIVLSIAIIFCTFTDLGISKSMVRYISLAVRKNKKKISAYHFYLLKIKLILTLFFSILLLILAYPISFYIFKNQELFFPLLVAAIYIFILSFEGFYSSIFYPIEKIKYISFKETASQILKITFVTVIIYFIKTSYQIIGIFLALILTHLLLLIFNLYYSKKLIPSLFKKSQEKINKKRVRKFVWFLTIASISAVFFSYIDSIMLGFFLLPEYVGYYHVSFSLIIGIVGMLSFLPLLLISVFTKLEIRKVNIVFNKVFKYVSMITIPSVFGLLVLGDYFIKIFFGDKYLPSSLSLYFLAPLVFVIVSTGLFVSLFSAKEKPQIFARLILITCLINILLNFILIKTFSFFLGSLWATAGAAIATTTSWIFYLFSSGFYTKREFNVSLHLKSITKPLISSIIMFLSLYSLILYIKDVHLIAGIFLVLEGIIIYFAILFLIRGIKKEEIKFIAGLIKRGFVKPINSNI